MGHLIYQVFYQEKCELERIVHFEKNDHVLITLNASESWVSIKLGYTLC